MEKIKAVNFYVKKLEGKRSGKEFVANSWTETNEILSNLRFDCPPKGQGYDKTRVEITFADGAVFKDRLDLNSDRPVDVVDHIKTVLKYQSKTYLNGDDPESERFKLIDDRYKIGD